jgi:hypothetical protein
MVSQMDPIGILSISSRQAVERTIQRRRLSLGVALVDARIMRMLEFVKILGSLESELVVQNYESLAERVSGSVMWMIAGSC